MTDRLAAVRPSAFALVAWLALAACDGGAPTGAEADGPGTSESASASAATVAAIPIPENLVIRVTGYDYQWHLLYPGVDGEFGTADDFEVLRHIRVPENTHVRLDLESRDYMYQLAVPDFGVREIAVPDLHFSMEFGSGAAGTHRLEGDQFCGFTHPDLFAELHVLEPAAYREWVASQK